MPVAPAAVVDAESAVSLPLVGLAVVDDDEVHAHELLDSVAQDDDDDDDDQKFQLEDVDVDVSADSVAVERGSVGAATVCANDYSMNEK